MLNFLKIAIVTDYNLKVMINSGDCTSIVDCPFDIAQEFDYAQTAFVDVERNYIIYWSDNIHSDPDMYIEAFTDALSYVNVEYTIEKVVMMSKDVKEKYKGVEY